jgi:hypothetical protein
MSKPFQRPPLSPKEKERLADSIIDNARATPANDAQEKKGVLFLRVPQSLCDDLDRIYKLTGYKKNVFCLHAIIEAAKDKLKQIERDL